MSDDPLQDELEITVHDIPTLRKMARIAEDMIGQAADLDALKPHAAQMQRFAFTVMKDLVNGLTETVLHKSR